MKTMMLINMLLDSALETCPGILVGLQHAFEAADEESRASDIACHELLVTLVQKLWAFRPIGPGRSAGPSILFGGKSNEFIQDAVQALEFDQCEAITRADFLALALGRYEQEVILHMYDLSKGVASAITPWLFDEQLQGVWHTAVVVWGREYYFGGDIYYDYPGRTGFGNPVKVLWLGHTLRRQEELHTFIVDELKPVFSREAYDAATNNCNHFSDRLTMHLVGKHIPEEVLRQPQLVMNTAVGRALRPLLNRWFGVHLESRDGGANVIEPGIATDSLLDDSSTVQL